MPVDEPRTAFDPASRRPSNPTGESGSPPPSGKRPIGEVRGEAAWRHPRQVKELFAHTDDRKVDIMMSSLFARVARRNVSSFVAQAVAVDDRVPEIAILDDTLELNVNGRCALFSFGAAARPCHASLDVIDQKSHALIIGRI